MEEVKIYYREKVEIYMNELVFSLYQKNYFGFLEDAIEYKNNIIEFIQKNINGFPFKFSPFALRDLGTKYIFYKSNKRTVWYIFFEEKNNTFLITFITNSHSEIAKFLNN